MVAPCGVGNGGALHLGADGAGNGDDVLLLLLAADELVAAGNAAGAGMAGVDGLGGGKSIAAQSLVCCIGQGHAGDLACGIAEDGDVHIVVHSVGGNHHVGDIQFGAQGACDAGVHQMGHAVDAAQDLGAHGGVDLAHAALDDDHIQAFQLAGAELHTGDVGGLQALHLLFQSGDLHIHGADDSKFDHNFSPYSG